MFKFSNHPAAVGISDGIQDAFGYLEISWRIWLPVVVAIGLVSLFLDLAAGTITLKDIVYTDPYTGRAVLAANAASKIARLAASSALVALVTLVGSWVFNAAAIAGLRNGRVTPSGVIVRGLLTLLVAFLELGIFFVCLLGMVMVTVIVPPIGILLFLAAIPVAFYIALRLIFVQLAVFDGFGPIAAMQESWRLSQRSVMRLFGWGVVAGLIGLGFEIVATILTAPASDSGFLPLAQGLSTLVGATSSCLIVFMMAVLYESQRARMGPGPAYAPGQGYPAAPYPYPTNPYGAGPYPYPAAPYPYPAGPYAPGPYAPGPYPYPAAPYPYPAAPSAPGPYPPGAGPAGPSPAAPGSAYPGPSGPGPASPPTGPLPYQDAAPSYPGRPTAIPGWVTPDSPRVWPSAQSIPPVRPESPDAGNESTPNQSGTVAPEEKPTDPPA